MAISIHGQYANPKKSPWNFEKYQSDLENYLQNLPNFLDETAA